MVINFASCVVTFVVSFIFIVPAPTEATRIATTITTTCPTRATARLHESKPNNNACINLVFISMLLFRMV